MYMVDESHSNDSQVVNWEYLPNTFKLCQYLNIRDLKELSITCKRYRNQFESKILEKLRLDRWALFFADRKRFIKLNGEKALDHLTNLLKVDLESKYHLVKEITFCNAFHSQYAKKIANLFPHVVKLKFSTDFKDEYYFGLLAILNGMKNLKHLEFFIYEYSTSCFNISDQPFSKSLKSLVVEVEEVHSKCLSIFDTIDSSYTSLITLSITSNKMLSNLSTNMQNLKDIRICSNSELDEDLLLKFVKLNPQLTRLDARFIKYSKEIFTTILSLKHLSCFYIDFCLYEGHEISKDFPLNYSIKKLKFDRDTHQSIISLLIKNCKNLDSIEFYNYDFEKKHISIWDGLNRRINTLKFNYCYFDKYAIYIQKLGALNLFSRATIISYDNVVNIVEYLNLDTLDSYRLILNTHEEPKSCTIITIKQ
ncbi:hypothetical protein CONCODRAFT_7616 [Conidiobolus coronatus NRRL 28638]|uniref:F-box domain-containing protein n=1 Tax=Conidiobolus coronatus (strain ATCC 28846 / CBS 209.66 / NRRL 28638) TaxID=796925 RepID=A0A137P4H8_CONC2|nr:hypothetical protein CONCODRAFT_7616 [Conidiobolus coronatus NRRL 28638]|eukprot:KXN69917.1 hypothetical protein CONCODRAFT_7616 [Conidiobolus coronatus NRRL 28638]